VQPSGPLEKPTNITGEVPNDNDNTDHSQISHSTSTFSPSRHPSVPIQGHTSGATRAMMTEGDLQIKKLSEEATRAAIEFGAWLRDARFRKFENYEICDDSNGVVDNSQKFLEHFEPPTKVQ
jgi:hypothetical protein